MKKLLCSLLLLITNSVFGQQCADNTVCTFDYYDPVNQVCVHEGLCEPGDLPYPPVPCEPDATICTYEECNCIGLCVIWDDLSMNQADCETDGDHCTNDVCHTGSCMHYLIDLNGDEIINFQDLGLLLGHWGPCVPGENCADLTGDDVVDSQDLALILGHWNNTCGPT